MPACRGTVPMSHSWAAAGITGFTLLVVQAQLIRTGRHGWHRLLGQSSYVLAPAVVIVTTLFVHYRIAPALRGVAVLPPFALHFLALTLISIVAFALFYALAIWF